MSITWQDLVTAGILLVVAGYLIRCLVRFIRRKGMPACGCCGQCSAEAAEKPLVNLDEPPGE
jgi:hypothetical protein